VERLVQKKPRAKTTEIVTAFTAGRLDRSFMQPVAAQIPCLLSDDLKCSLPTVEEIEAELTRKGQKE
jgi:hypothetical protein